MNKVFFYFSILRVRKLDKKFNTYSGLQYLSQHEKDEKYEDFPERERRGVLKDNIKLLLGKTNISLSQSPGPKFACHDTQILDQIPQQ